MREIDQRAVEAVQDEYQLSEFLKLYESFIIRTASKTAKRYISKQDEEWAIALTAFSDAVKKYNYERGSFISFAQLMIRNSLVDYYRIQKKYSHEIQVESIEDQAMIENSDYGLRYEIEAITKVLSTYKISFMDLADCSPKAGKTKVACARAVSYLLQNPLMMSQMQELKQLPVKTIEEKTRLPRKIIERHRKYIIAVAEILHGDYPYLAEYVSYIREEEII